MADALKHNGVLQSFFWEATACPVYRKARTWPPLPLIPLREHLPAGEEEETRRGEPTVRRPPDAPTGVPPGGASKLPRPRNRRKGQHMNIRILRICYPTDRPEFLDYSLALNGPP